MEDTSARARRGRAKIGETRSFVVERRDEGKAPVTKTIDITYTALPLRDMALTYAAVLIGLCFVACGLVACLTAPAKSATLLALAEIDIGTAFFAGPYLSSYFLRTLVNSIQGLAILLGFAFLLHYMLETPNQRPFLERKHARAILYGPALLMVVFFLFLVVVRPRATGGLNQITNILFGLFYVAYLGCTVFVIARRYANATPKERAALGFNITLAGTLIGLLPFVILVLVGIVAPKVVLPGNDFYFLTTILIPISLTAAMLRQSRAV